MKKLTKRSKIILWGVGVIISLIIIAVIVFEFFLKQKPFATSDDYWAQLENHQLLLDCEGHWDYWMGTNDVMAFSQAELFPPPIEPYDMQMYKKWVDTNNVKRPVNLAECYGNFSDDGDYGWPKEALGIAWMYALHPWVWASPSVAIIEPGKTAETLYGLNEAIKMYRNPATWIDYAIDQQWGDPMLKNVMWKGPLLIAEGLYALMSGDKDKYGPEIKSVARDLFKTQQENLKKPWGEGYVGGVCCEPNQWFPQCNSMAVLGFALYDKVYGIDEKYGILIGKKYREEYFKFIKKYMINPDNGLLFRKFHPYGPQQVDKSYSAFPNVFACSIYKTFEPELAERMYGELQKNYIKKFPFGIGSYILEVPERDSYQNLLNLGSDSPGMIGESASNIFLAWYATREFDDKENFDGLNTLFSNLCYPYYSQGEVRFDETNDEPIEGLTGFTVGRIINMSSGWWLLAKVHVGWKTILEYDWSQNHDEHGNPLNYR